MRHVRSSEDSPPPPTGVLEPPAAVVLPHERHRGVEGKPQFPVGLAWHGGASCSCMLISWGHDDRHVCSGTYDNKLLLWDAFGSDNSCTTLESVSNSSPRRNSTLKGKLGLTRKDSSRNFSKKILHHSHHPMRNLVAIGARNSLYLFTAN